MFICSSRLCRKPASLGFQEILSWSLMLFYPMGGTGTVCMALLLHWFCMFWFHKINQNIAALVRPSPKNFRILCCAQAIQSLGISKIWLWSTCAGKTEQAEQFQARHTSRPWICWKRSGRTWRSFSTSRLWHFFANIRRIGLRQWLDAFVAIHCFCFWFQLVYHGWPPFKSIQKRHFPEGKTKATRSPTSSERAARPSSASWCLKEASGDGRPMTSLSSRWRRQCLRWRVTSWPWRLARMSRRSTDELSWPATVEYLPNHCLWQSQLNTCSQLQSVSPLGRGQHCFTHKTLKRREL